MNERYKIKRPPVNLFINRDTTCRSQSTKPSNCKLSFSTKVWKTDIRQSCFACKPVSIIAMIVKSARTANHTMPSRSNLQLLGNTQELIWRLSLQSLVVPATTHRSLWYHCWGTRYVKQKFTLCNNQDHYASWKQRDHTLVDRASGSCRWWVWSSRESIPAIRLI